MPDSIMVVRQILVLFVLVRIQVGQQNLLFINPLNFSGLFFSFPFFIRIPFFSVKTNELPENRFNFVRGIDKMRNSISKLIIVLISLFVGLLHFLIGPDYQGVFKNFIRGYLIDILLPMNLYLLLQISLRQHFTLNKARLIGISLYIQFWDSSRVIAS